MTETAPTGVGVDDSPASNWAVRYAALRALSARRAHRSQHFGHTARALLRFNRCSIEVVPVPRMADTQPTRSRRVTV